jgi:hypothetical protein
LSVPWTRLIHRTRLFWVIAQQTELNYYRRFGTTCRSHPQPHRMEPIGCTETSVINYHY